MKKLIVAVVLIAAVVVIVPRALEHVMGSMQQDDARRRVTMILEAMAKDPKDEQTATCLWMADTLVLPRDQMERAWDKWYPIWQSQPFADPTGWSVESVEPVEPKGTFRVKVASGSRSVLLDVVAKEQIRVVE